MKYSSLGQVFDVKRKTFESLKQTLLPLSALQLSFRPAEGEWSVTEIAEHLALVESRLARLITVSCRKAERSGNPPIQSRAFSVDIPDGVERNDFFKVKTKQEYEPTGTVPIGESMDRLQSIHNDLLALQPNLERIDISSISFDHWLLGSLTLGQWIAFIGIHEQRHLGQIRSILASASYPKR